LVKLAERNLTNVQKRVLLYIHQQEAGRSCTYSWYVRAVSADLKIPESTAKWCLSNLREMQLIDAGTSARRGVPLRLTYPGIIVASGLSICPWAQRKTSRGGIGGIQ
jgi:DNA-binding MarR family transcriptional regulator